jgi:hypothetical protein
MERSAELHAVEPAGPGELDALGAAIEEAIAALVAWNLPAFQSAVECQRTLCERLACAAAWRQSPEAAAAAGRVRKLNRVYGRLLRHSMHWTHTLQSIFEAAGNPLPPTASVHFRG